MSDIAKDLMQQLIATPDVRLGQDGINDFKSHQFFTGIDWDNIRDGISAAFFLTKLDGERILVYKDEAFI